MKSSQQRRLLTILSILLFLLLLWVLTAVQLDPTAAESSRISLSLQPRFGEGEGGRSLASITLTIINDFVQDLQLSLYEPAAQERASNLTPTEPPRDSQAEPSQPPTEDPGAQEDTPTPTDFPQATATPVSSAPTSTPEKPTATSTEGAKVSAFTSTPDPTPTVEPDDDHKPELSGGTLDVPDGSTISCETMVDVSDLRVFDPAYSAGIDWVKLKYKIEGSSKGYQYSSPLSKTSGGWSDGEGSDWDALYKGDIEIEFEDAWALYAGPKALARVMLFTSATATPTSMPVATTSPSETPSPTLTPDPGPSATPTSPPSPTPTISATKTPTATPEIYTVQLWALAKDNDGNQGFLQLATYTMVCP